MELDKDRVARFLAEKQCNFIMSVPEASTWAECMGVPNKDRSVMNIVLASTAGRLDNAMLRTFLYKAIAIINSHPPTMDTINHSRGIEPLKLNHLIHMKASMPFQPPGKFVKEDLYARKKWQRVQNLTK